MNASGSQQTTSEDAPTGSPHVAGAVVSRKAERAIVRGPDGGELVRRARRGDRPALDQLLRDARPRAMAVALKMLRNPDDADDAVQDAFLKVWKNLGRFEGRASFSTWVHRIVMNACLDLRRRQACRPGSAEDAAGDDAVDEVIAPETPERALGRAEVGTLVQDALATLSPVHRQALTLRELEEHSYEEIAQTAACPIGTVMSRLHHARKKLAEELHACFAGEAPALCAA
jgi:RNA polymerase sigma-70 factor (ECF subfamily)